MSLTHHPLHDSPLLQVACVCCRPQDNRCGEEEQAPVSTLAFPLRGVFVKHHADGSEVVAHHGQALFFGAGQSYRVSHPADGGDDCLSLRPSAAMLDELLRRLHPAAADRDGQPFDATHLALPPALALQRGLLWRRLRDGDALALEIETRGLELFAATLAGSRSAVPKAQATPRASRRLHEQVRAIAILLSTQPEPGWTLDRLAGRVHASPFHLARGFHRLAGEPMHRFLLRARLLRALDAVLDSDSELTAIALTLGFSTPSHFAAAFRRSYGIAPSALRRQARGKQVRELRRISTAAADDAG